MLILEAEKIQTHMVCPRQYKYKYIDETPANKTLTEIESGRYFDIMKDVAMSLLKARNKGRVASFKTVENRWSKAWIKEEDAEAIKSGARPAQVRGSNTTVFNTPAAITKGASFLIDLYEWIIEGPSVPVIINEKYEVNLTRNIRLSTVIDTIMQNTETDRLEVYRFYGLPPGSSRYDVRNIRAQLMMDKLILSEKFADLDFYSCNFLEKKLMFRQTHYTPKELNQLKWWALDLYEDESFMHKRDYLKECTYCPYYSRCHDDNLIEDLEIRKRVVDARAR